MMTRLIRIRSILIMPFSWFLHLLDQTFTILLWVPSCLLKFTWQDDAIQYMIIVDLSIHQIDLNQVLLHIGWPVSLWIS